MRILKRGPLPRYIPEGILPHKFRLAAKSHRQLPYGKYGRNPPLPWPACGWLPANCGKDEWEYPFYLAAFFMGIGRPVIFPIEYIR